MPLAERLSSKFHRCLRSLASWPTIHFSDNLSALGIDRRCTSRRKGFIYLINMFYLSYTTEEMEDAAETADQFPLSAKRIALVDGGLAFNSPFPPLLRPERDVDIFLSFDFSKRKGDLEFPFEVNLSIDMTISTKLLTSWSCLAS